MTIKIKDITGQKYLVDPYMSAEELFKDLNSKEEIYGKPDPNHWLITTEGVYVQLNHVVSIKAMFIPLEVKQPIVDKTWGIDLDTICGETQAFAEGYAEGYVGDKITWSGKDIHFIEPEPDIDMRTERVVESGFNFCIPKNKTGDEDESAEQEAHPVWEPKCRKCNRLLHEYKSTEKGKGLCHYCDGTSE